MTEDTKATTANSSVLGDRAVWGKVGYAGEAHAAAPGTYPAIDALARQYTTIEDSGDYPQVDDGALANLTPLVMAALHEVGFAWEAGPLSTWSN
jgi:hypothetical protein